MNIKRLLIIGITLLAGVPWAVCGQSLQLADSLYQKGKQYDNSGHKKKSEFYYREAYNIYSDYQDTASLLKAGKEYASAMMWLSKNEKAMALYKKLLKIDHPASDAYYRGDLYNSMGLSSRKTGKLDQALTYYEKSLELAKQSKNSLLIGVVFSNFGTVYETKGNYTKAMDFYEKSLPYFKGINRKKNIAITFSNIGSIYSGLALYDQALVYFNRSLEIKKKDGDVRQLAETYQQIGSVQRKRGNYDQALVSYQKSLEFSRKAGTPKETASALNSIGLLYKQLGELDKALSYYQQSLAIAEKTAGPLFMATKLNNIGQLLWEQDKIEQASGYFIKAYKLRKKAGNPHEIYGSLIRMFRVNLEKEKFQEAKNYATQLKTIGDSTDSYKMLRTAAEFFGEIEQEKGNLESALTQYKKAYAYSEFLPPTYKLQSAKNMGSLYHKLNSDSAVTYGKKAIRLIEKHRSNAGAVSELKSGYFGQHSDFYTEVASWILTYSQAPAQAYKLVEQAKARSLSDQLARASQNIDQILPKEVRIERRKKHSQIEELYTRLEQTTDKDERADIEQKIRSVELNYAAYENNLHNEYPELKSLKSPEPISLERAQALTDEQTAVLEYALAGNQLIIFLISSSNVHVEQISLSDSQPLDEQLTDLVANFKGAILSNAPRAQLRSQSTELYNTLLKPFEDELESFSNLIIVPDGALAYLPFEALSRGDQYLIERFNIKYEPSLTSLALLKESESPSQQDLLAVAGSNFSGENNNNPRFRQSNLSALPSTLMEVDSIASQFPRSAILKEDEVSEERFKEMLQQNQYRYVHMATHGIIDEDRPSRSGLALSSEGELTASSKEDGMLRSSEIFGLDINSDMVVLSACNTGLGKVVKGEGILGMQRSFFYAGASTVVVSLWNVYDRSTASFMTEFYKALKNTPSEEGWTDSMLRWVGWDESIPFGPKAKAMRKAKLKMIKHPLFNHPVYWAPFIVVGR
ncbi:CHAT domain-containing protein [Fodinibius halophilus]|uniref:CHAT domain-containing protein n=1 Tax=Fodinibius halophilus TaxID=1736908 RepID=A0A6M1TEK1_9BACT|nr:CHAT domain-containing tetratricopeptide repeat protein [Fodinibius halophilus]NGP87060.1 CHAT domain-containing protein [Fodinibius halophilus]